MGLPTIMKRPSQQNEGNEHFKNIFSLNNILKYDILKFKIKDKIDVLGHFWICLQFLPLDYPDEK